MATRIPFDALTLAAVCSEIQGMIGGKVQGVRQPSDDSVVVEIYRQGQTRHLLLSCHAEFFRAHFITKRPSTLPTPPAFCSTLRTRLDGSVLELVTMKAGDRVLVLNFDGPSGPYRLIAELMGKHSNIFLIEPNGKVITAIKWIGISKSKRPITPGVNYSWPPVLGSGKDISDFRKIPVVHTKFPDALIGATDWEPGFVAGAGAYPLNLSSTFSAWVSRDSISIALENHYDQFVRDREIEQLRSALSNQLERVLLAREAALADLKDSYAQGGKAPMWQRNGELILAYAGNSPIGASILETQDYDGTPVQIKLDPEKNGKDNAQAYFTKAKKAKGRMGIVEDQIKRVSDDKDALEGFHFKILEATSKSQLENLQEDIRKRRWLNEQPVHKDGKAERPYDGHRIREYLGPGGYRVLLGENSESNDYLTMRMGKGNDWWLHVRGQTSAHVIIQTQGHPEKVQRETLLFAAKLAVRNSPQKHAGFVTVDYTLKKYVRKPKGSPKGTVYYTNEKTLDVQGD